MVINPIGNIIKCENCNKTFTTKQRKINHFKMCNYTNIERENTNLKFENFLLKSTNYNNISFQNKLYNIYKDDISKIFKLLENIEA
jgi:hypothetical protein|tara:strand:+ start:53 stop:310 length:258 start_codon:yes stop_codon:yes gene_type:complete